ncbi:hypothetical protein UA08_02709 [Talaromyces atroroseus]|uniref:GTP binding protein n=1 Tax=Talaromyces atroroseus TaxID=1441469 RepID=A0A225B576_TALAT|nr:hypothetical protein UA08_02709 [Talaromyces atroroseus]OKL62015.1 hypothetical protein UA08_02709 [Talaromyces atroroseus]
MTSQTHEDSSLGLATEKTTPSQDLSSIASDMPSVDSVLSRLENPHSLALSGELEGFLAKEDEEEHGRLLHALQKVLSKTESGDEDTSFDVQELRDALEMTDAIAEQERHVPQMVGGAASILQKLWQSKSRYMVEAAEALANASRDPSWRIPFGQSGVLEFFLQLIATREGTDTDLLFHSLRLIGNSCADTDENRDIVVSGKYTISIMRLLNPDLVHIAEAGLGSIAITVLYNICTDYEPAQAQAAAYRLGYILLKLMNDGDIEGNNFTYELIEMTTGQGDGIENSPESIILLILNIALDGDTPFVQFASLVACLTNYLQTERFQIASVQQKWVRQIASVLRRSFSIQVDESSTEETQLLAQLRLKINQALADISALPQFLEVYPIGSPLLNDLQSWLAGPEESLQICACVMLGNVARTDTICRLMIEQLGIHRSLIDILKTNTRGGVLHAVLGFLKNLAIAQNNREELGDADIIPAVSQLWKFDTVPQVQLAATSVTRLVITSSVKNISRLLASLSSAPDSPDYSRTYLSTLLSLSSRTDTAPIKTEIGRTISSICRTLVSRARESEGAGEDTTTPLNRLFDLHEDVASPIGAMITQTEWPVVRSEGWFALALMASHVKGSVAVVNCLSDTNVNAQVEKSFELGNDEPTTANGQLQRKKDRDNLVVMVKELLGNNPENLSEPKKTRLRELMNNAVSLSLQGNP